MLWVSDQGLNSNYVKRVKKKEKKDGKVRKEKDVGGPCWSIYKS